ncbi:hypothetical protein BDW59DRAFT_120718 [Aspergillus cavernicola]|uniref:Uncharacterized protein n=1 Tax=Aspergillus cavernicola TaxID=176166 RepID=A0ABR4HWT0_9EURO
MFACGITKELLVPANSPLSSLSAFSGFSGSGNSSVFPVAISQILLDLANTSNCSLQTSQSSWVPRVVVLVEVTDIFEKRGSVGSFGYEEIVNFVWENWLLNSFTFLSVMRLLIVGLIVVPYMGSST